MKFRNFCNYYGAEANELIIAYDSENEAEQIIANILSVVGLKPNFEIRAGEVANAAVVNGVR